MRLFGRKSASNKRCPDCRNYYLVEGHGFCAKEMPSTVNVRMLTGTAIKRQCPRCPEEMTCTDWTTK